MVTLVEAAYTEGRDTIMSAAAHGNVSTTAKLSEHHPYLGSKSWRQGFGVAELAYSDYEDSTNG